MQLRVVRCTYEGSQLLKWHGNPVGMPMKRCKNDGEKMQKRYLTEHILSPLIRGGSKAGFYLMVHRDTETQRVFEHRTHKKNCIDADKQNSQTPLLLKEGLGVVKQA